MAAPKPVFRRLKYPRVYFFILQFVLASVSDSLTFARVMCALDQTYKQNSAYKTAVMKIDSCLPIFLHSSITVGPPAFAIAIATAPENDTETVLIIFCVF